VSLVAGIICPTNVLWVLIALQWLHILAGIFWFGSAMTAHLIAFPAFSTFQPETRRSIIEAFAARYGRLVGLVAGLTILLGILRGLTGGVLNVLTSPYGLTWAAAIVLGLGIAAFEGLRISPTVGKLIATSDAGQIQALDDRLTSYGKIHLGGFLVIFTLMIAMRFGY
jgi:uncharacterized membrane protein